MKIDLSVFIQSDIMQKKKKAFLFFFLSFDAPRVLGWISHHYCINEQPTIYYQDCPYDKKTGSLTVLTQPSATQDISIPALIAYQTNHLWLLELQIETAGRKCWEKRFAFCRAHKVWWFWDVMAWSVISWDFN